MKLFDKIFKKKKIIEIYSPIYGNIIPLSEVPDVAFSSGIIGDGIGIIPTKEGTTVYSPCNANEFNIFETNHAISLETEDKLEVIIHFGIDTVNLNGKGFEKLTNKEENIKCGDSLIKYDLDYIINNAKSHKSAIVISSMDLVDTIEKSIGKVKPGDLIMKVTLKR